MDNVIILLLGTPRFAVAVLATLTLSIWICGHRIAGKKQFFFVTALASAVFVNAILFVVTLLLGQIHVYGWRIFTSAAWEWNGHWKGGGLENAVVGALFWARLSTYVSLLPALAVGFYYDRRSIEHVRNSKTIKGVGYVLLFSFLALVFYFVHYSNHPDDTEVIENRVVRIIVGLCAGLVAVFFIIRAFYSAFARRDCAENHDKVA